MPTTRRSVRKPPSPDGNHSSSSSSGGSIPARPPLRRQPLTGTGATLRPSRDPVPSSLPSTKRTRDAGAPSHAPQSKRRKVSDIRESIEVQEDEEEQGEDNNIDAALNATRIGRTPNIAVMLPSSRRTHKTREVSPTGAPSGRLRARHLRQGINSGKLARAVPESPPSAQPPALVAKGKGKAVRGRSESPDERLGSPELQSSALKRRQGEPRPDLYAVLDDEEEEEEAEPASPLARQPPRLVRGQAKGPRKLRRGRQFAQSKRLSSIREEQNSGRSRPALPTAATRRPPGRTALLNRGPERPEAYEESEEDEGAKEVEESDQLEDDEEVEAEAAQCSVEIQVVPYNRFHRRISVSSGHLNNMLGTVGKIGWTGVGRTWRANLRSLGEPEFGGGLPGLTKSCRNLFRSLSDLIDELEEVPNALDLAGQSRFLEERKEVLNAAMSNANDAVNTTQNSAAAAASRVANPMDSPFLLVLVDDLSAYIIPMLVICLQASFSIGVAEPDAESSEFLPDDGTFTSTTVQYMMWISTWLSGLMILVPNVRPPTDEEQVATRNQRYDPDNPAQNRARFGAMARKWKQHLKAGVSSFNANADRERDIEQKKQRDMVIRAQRQRQEEEQRAKDLNQQSAFQQWLLNVRTQPRPLAELFHKTTEAWPRLEAPSSSAPVPQSSAPQSVYSTPARSQTAPRLLLPPPPPPPQQQPPSRNASYPPWPEDEVAWLLGELARPDWGPGQLEICAETLDRPVAEVSMEMERLAVLGRGRRRG
ncbi:hypothetical protein C8A05DRAFT_15290 [Staphylotrichum tortipilum]|uniref:Uncharacterized protein n=1 Tax=Staphylotrichum tortipilum TaxID=2831512 RepID=A0AAN6MLX1_9PEZI|nr:hypothetical protein C8A05DRAFT_15290 [Staphylotrichum longicolle]